MNWKEFKEIIENQGVVDDMEISWIDIHCSSNMNPPEVKISKCKVYGKTDKKSFTICDLV